MGWNGDLLKVGVKYCEYQIIKREKNIPGSL